ncbi:hypothetical protein [Mucilaginibacter rubeus]|uniref:SGNH/GDSL hydrolase family protein n=1 Tax=Mucilaginibacter rubeus TaxID=2027860 RepID=A0A5C1HW17_9SPHI|nr:hypothetical protein [Mucilaginibacter rubeus]QEM09643.1 hypothetical protein DEO27_006275 [Mucilaginibacter rubeus]
MKQLKENSNKFFIRLLLMIVAFVAVDQIAGACLYYFFTHQASGEYAVANHVVYNLNEDVLVLGSSRASHHYNSSLIKDSLKLSCFNGGRDGEGLLYSTAIFELALQRHIPKVVILDVTSDVLSEKEDEKSRLSILLPYLKQSDVVGNMIEKKGKLELLKSSLQTYRYNGQVVSIFQHYFLSSGNAVMGFDPLTNKMDASKVSTHTSLKPYSDSISADNVEALNLLISECKRKKIQLFVFVSPRYNDDTQQNSYLKMKSICNNNKVIFHDFTNDVYFKNPEYYSDRAHLNSRGADLYTDTVAAFVKRRLASEANVQYLSKNEIHGSLN